MPFLRYLTIFSFKKYNPGWKINLYRPKLNFQGEKTWNTAECYSSSFTGKDYLLELKKLNIDIVEVDFKDYNFYNNVPEVFKADFLRWKILSTQGGLWSDCDIIYFKSIDSLYINNDDYCQIDTIICLGDLHRLHRIGFLLGKQNNKFFKFIDTQTANKFNKSDYQCIGSKILNEYFFDKEIIIKSYPDSCVFNIDMDVVYPLNENLIPIIFNNNNGPIINKRTIGVHWYGGHPVSNKWEHSITENNYRDYNNSLCQIITEVVGK